MQISKNKTATILIALSLVLTITIPLICLPIATAHEPTWKIATYAYVNVAPDRVGLGQTVFLTMWAYFLLPSAAIPNDIRMTNYKLNLTKPDGTTQILGPFTGDTTNTIYTTYTPDQIGTYSVVLFYPDLVYYWSGTYQNDTFLGATSDTIYFTVQQDPLPAIVEYPLPTEYWTRPIEGQNSDWSTISSHWLGTGSPQIGSTNFQQDGAAPSSAHIVWTKPIQDGGVVGGSNVGIEGNTFYQGGSYNHRFANPIIMYGRIYYREPLGLSGTAGDTVCIDLRTGKEVWRRTDIPVLSYGYYYDADTPNQHGVFYEGMLFTSNFGQAFDPRTGNPLFNVTNVPSGSASLGLHGEILRYNIANAGTTASPNWRLSQWNSSKLWNLAANTPTIASSVNASTSDRFDWNVSIPWYTGMSSVSVYAAFVNDVLLGSNGTLPAWSNTNTQYTMWAVSLKPESAGQLLWMKTIQAPAGNISIIIRPETVDSKSRIFTIYEKETMNWNGYSLDSGDKLWGPVKNLRPFDTFSGSVTTENTGSHQVAYGNLYVSGYGGLLYCINATTGERQWIYGGDNAPGNNTFSGLASPWGYWPIFIAAIAEGKIYLFTNEHSPNTPQYKGALIRCLNATTGQEIWTLTGWGEGGSFMSNNGAIADGFYAYLNTYDMQIYSVGKGPSAVTVTAPEIGVPYGSSLTIRGTVMDISSGTTQTEQASRFPNGVPAVSDQSMKGWMEYVYMQKPRPTDVTGVPVTLSVIDANNNFRTIGTVTADSDGFFSFDWKPDIQGKYTLYASFSGSESYWPSHATTAFTMDSAPEPTTAPTPAQLSVTDIYFGPAVAGIIAAIAIVGALILLALRKRP